MTKPVAKQDNGQNQSPSREKPSSEQLLKRGRPPKRKNPSGRRGHSDIARLGTTYWRRAWLFRADDESGTDTDTDTDNDNDTDIETSEPDATSKRTRPNNSIKRC